MKDVFDKSSVPSPLERVKERLTLVKVGGKIVEKPESLNRFLAAFSKIEGYKVLVHGGGRSATAMATRLGIESKWWTDGVLPMKRC